MLLFHFIIPYSTPENRNPPLCWEAEVLPGSADLKKTLYMCHLSPTEALGLWHKPIYSVRTTGITYLNFATSTISSILLIHYEIVRKKNNLPKLDH